MNHDEDSEPVGTKGQCPCDDPSQSFQLYSDGHGHCFAGGCPHPFWSARKLKAAGWDVDVPDGDYQPVHSTRPRMSDDLKALLEGSEVRAITRWGISQATAAHWDYRARIAPNGDMQHVAVVRDEQGQIVAAHVRNTGQAGDDKDFFWVGEPKLASLYGSHLLGNGGKMVVVCEGEKDTMQVSQLWALRFPVCGVIHGVQNAHRDVAKVLDKLGRFDKVVIAFDMDEPGREAALKVARLFPAGKAHIANLGAFKDCHEMHAAGKDKELISALHNASPYRPDGIVSADDLDATILNPVARGSSFQYEFLTKWTYGKRPGEIIVCGAGSGIGKSDFMLEDAANEIAPVMNHDGNWHPIAVFNYEAGAPQTYKAILGKLWDRRFHIPAPEDGSENLYWTEDELRQASAFRREECARLFINDHFGAVDWDSVKERIRYLKHSEGIVGAYIDPVAALVAQEENDTKALDRLFAEAKSLAEELGVWLWFNSHLTRPSDGKSHEEGGRVLLKQFRGSNAIIMWASFVLGMERDQQSEDEAERAVATIRMLKDRFTGDSTGKTHRLTYNSLTGRYEEFASAMPVYEEPPAEEAPPLSDAARDAQ